MNNLASLGDALNVNRDIKINEQDNSQEEVVFKQELKENELVSDSKVTLLLWLLTYFFHLHFSEIKIFTSHFLQFIL